MSNLFKKCYRKEGNLSCATSSRRKASFFSITAAEFINGMPNSTIP